MECLKNLTPDGLRQHLETLGFHFGPPDNHGRHDQYGYWMATIPGCGHTGQQSPATSNTAEHGFTLRQQKQPGVIRTACRTCLQETLVTLPETMSMRGSRPPAPSVPALWTEASNDLLVHLISMTPFTPTPGSVLNLDTRNWDTFSVRGCCSVDHTMLLHRMPDGSHEAWCHDCGPDTAARKFAEAFRIGVMMAAATDLHLIEPRDRPALLQ